MTKAIWLDTVIAESDQCIEIEGNQYFPPASVKQEHLRPSLNTSICPWKGMAHYYDVIVGDEANKDGAWIYHEPNEAAKQIKDYVAFWHGVEIIQE